MRVVVLEVHESARLSCDLLCAPLVALVLLCRTLIHGEVLDYSLG